MKEKEELWPDKEEKDVKFNANLWEAFCNFESCVRDSKSETFTAFFTRWQDRLEKMEVFGIMYPDQLLVMKLSYACHLDLATVLGLLNVITEQKDGDQGKEEKLWMKAKDILCEIKQEVDEVESEELFAPEAKDELSKAEVIVKKLIAPEELGEEESAGLDKALDNVVVYFDDDQAMDDVMDSFGDPDYDDDEEDFEEDVKPLSRRKKITIKKKLRKSSNIKRIEMFGPDDSFPKTCTKCGKENASKKHFIDCHNEFKCVDCQITFSDKAKLDAHVERHVPELCLKCGQLQASNVALRKHMRSSGCAERKECPICGLKCHPRAFKGHVARHSDSKNHSCDREGCTKSFFSEKLLEEHILKIHDKIRSFHCNLCEDKFFTEKQLLYHNKCKHEDLPLFCERCGKSGVGVPRHLMQRHLRMCTNEYECKLCTVKFADKERYDKHCAKHTEHTCEKCKKVLPTLKKYRQHISYSGCAERVMCKYCGQHFSPCVIKKHEGKHKSDQNYQCPREGCDECFHNEIRLKRHLDKHDGIRNYTCDVCSKGFFSARDVKRHKEFTHMKIEGKHECGICGKKYHAPCNLEVHIKSHTGEKGFPCTMCDKAFTRKHKLNKHIAIVHNGVKPEVKIWSCQVCSKEFTKQYNLMRHYKSVHKFEHDEIYGTKNMKPVKIETAA